MLFLACEEETAPVNSQEKEEIVEPDMRYGYDFNLYNAKQLKIKETPLGPSLAQRIDYPQVYDSAGH